MSNTYKINLTDSEAVVVGQPDVYLQFAHHDFTIVWNEQTSRQDVVHGTHTFYGGEGQSFDTWQDAIHVSLYDYFQYGEEFKDGDVFVVKFLQATAKFKCEGVHVILIPEVK